MNSKVVFLLIFSFTFINCRFEGTFSNFRVGVDSKVQEEAAFEVLIRLLGREKTKFFSLKIRESLANEKDGFTILKSESDTKVSVTGPNGVSLVWGVHYYLKNYCHCHISWDGDQLELPEVLPSVNVTQHSVDRLRYYQNVCTSSYSFVWWKWDRWEREIDWMALNGVNLALAFTAQEAIWQRVYDDMKVMTDFTGPAFLAWNRMGNLRNFSYGLSSNWHRHQVALQHKILKRMRDLGITPVLPAFCGIVPKSFKEVYPLANLSIMPKWNNFEEDYCCPYLLDPSDILFSIVSQTFLREYIKEFGTNHIYNCDTFNENTPSSGDLQYLSHMSRSIYEKMNEIDPYATWMVQGWAFIHSFWSKERVEAFVTGVPAGRMLILDLQSDLTPQYERLDSYFGQPFIWCTLLNFGGQLGMYGHLKRINKGVVHGREFKNSTMVGIGITPEGIDQNYIVFDFTLESSLRSGRINLTEWVAGYTLRRYRIFNENAKKGWLILKDTAYNFRPQDFRFVGVNGAKPGKFVNGEHISKNILTKLPSRVLFEPSWYNRSRILDVFNEFLSASEDDAIASSDLFRHDFIDVTRQTIQFAVSNLYFRMVKEFNSKDAEKFRRTSATLLNILNELDSILKTGSKFLLGKWLEEAKDIAENEKEMYDYEYNARNQITLWGPRGEIRDYAAKQWSGMIADFYKPRWRIFVEALNESLVTGAPFNSSQMKERIYLTVERPFCERSNFYPSTPQGNAIHVIRTFYSNWRTILLDIFKTTAYNDMKLLKKSKKSSKIQT